MRTMRLFFWCRGPDRSEVMRTALVGEVGTPGLFLRVLVPNKSEKGNEHRGDSQPHQGDQITSFQEKYLLWKWSNVDVADHCGRVVRRSRNEPSLPSSDGRPFKGIPAAPEFKFTGGVHRCDPESMVERLKAA